MIVPCTFGGHLFNDFRNGDKKHVLNIRVF